MGHILNISFSSLTSCLITGNGHINSKGAGLKEGDLVHSV